MPSQSASKAASDIASFAARSHVSFKREKDGRVTLQASFVYRSLRYELEGSIDGAHPGPMKHRLSSGKSVVYEATVLTGTSRSRVEMQFGKATDGVRSLMLDVEPLASGALVSGHADGNDLLPMRAPGCGCASARSAAEPRPLLAWDDKGNTQAVRLALPKSLLAEAGGLAQVVETTLARLSGGGGLGDIIDIVDWALCYVECVGEFLWCVIRQPDIPRTRDIFNLLCVVLWGACTTTCRIKTPF
jgi:hypothetical protein